MSGRARPLALGLLILALAPVASARAAGSAAESRGAPTQDGWWNRLQGPAEGEPEGNPVRPLVPPVPKPPNVPGDTIVTSAAAGQVDKVAAIGIGLALADGATGRSTAPRRGQRANLGSGHGRGRAAGRAGRRPGDRGRAPRAGVGGRGVPGPRPRPALSRRRGRQPVLPRLGRGLLHRSV